MWQGWPPWPPNRRIEGELLSANEAMAFTTVSRRRIRISKGRSAIPFGAMKLARHQILRSRRQWRFVLYDGAPPICAAALRETCILFDYYTTPVFSPFFAPTRSAPDLRQDGAPPPCVNMALPP